MQILGAWGSRILQTHLHGILPERGMMGAAKRLGQPTTTNHHIHLLYSELSLKVTFINN
jgi:hypothetical protein